MIDDLRAAQGLKKRALSDSREDSEKWRLFDETVNQVRKAVASIPAGELEDTIEKAILNARKRKGWQVPKRSRK
jgi:hypothetical protein